MSIFKVDSVVAVDRSFREVDEVQTKEDFGEVAFMRSQTERQEQFS